MQNRRIGSTFLTWIAVVLVAILSTMCAHAQEPVKVPAPEAAKLLIQPAASPVNPLKAAHVTGVVHLEIVVDAKGTVTDMKDLDSTDTGNTHGVLARAAKEAVQQYHYHPYLVKGQPTAMRTTVDVPFGR